MLQKLIKSSIENKLTIGILTVALIIWGGWSLSQLPFDSTPDITNNQVQVITQAPSLGAQEVEQFITTPVEMALANIPRVTERGASAAADYRSSRLSSTMPPMCIGRGSR